MKRDFITLENWDKVRSISGVNKTKDKIALAKYYSTDKSFVELVQLAYDPYKRFKIVKIDNKFFGLINEINEDISPKSFLLKMIEKKAANNKDKIKCAYILNELAEDDPSLAILFTRVFRKDLKCGMNVRNWNKAGYDIPVFDLQLAKPQSYLEKFLKENPKKCYAHIKYDGVRCHVTIDDESNVIFRSRNGIEFVGLDCLKHYFAKNFPSNTILDGEFMHKSLILQNAVSIIKLETNTEESCQDLYYVVFDILQRDKLDLTNFPFKLRLEMMQLEQLLFNRNGVIKIRIAEGKPLICDEKEIWEYYDYVRSIGQEGLILKSLDGIYECKRSKTWVKIKPKELIDLEVIDIVPGEIGGEYENALGAAIVNYEGVLVHVGGAWSRKERHHYWKNPNELIGKTIEIAYMMKTQKGSLLHARKIRIRNDK